MGLNKMRFKVSLSISLLNAKTESSNTSFLKIVY
nr:MAG TPA: hypothetical protein [Caudoviricetes sp.]DAS02312.1 MAG TPA: hypothetical protein [Caudoviricetes sp.]